MNLPFISKKKNPVVAYYDGLDQAKRELSKIGEVRSVFANTSGFTNGSQNPSYGAWQMLKLTTIWRCVNIIANTIAALPIRVYNTEGGKTQETLPALGNLAFLFQYKPNTFQTANTWLTYMVTSYLLRGETIAFIQRGIGGQAAEIIPVNPDQVIINFDNATQQKLYNIHGTTFREEDVLHVVGTTIDGLRGVSPFLAHMETIDTAFKMGTYTNKYFSNGGTPSGILYMDANYSKDDIKGIKDEWRSSQVGIENAHSFATLPPGWKFDPISIKPEDGQIIQTRQFGVEEIARIFGVPLSKLGVMEKVPNQNIETQSVSFLEETLEPILAKFESAFRFRLIDATEVNLSKIEFDRNHFIKTDIKTYNQTIIDKVNAGIFTANEGRVAFNKNPLPGLDSIRIQQGFALIDSNGTIIQLSSPAATSEDGVPIDQEDEIQGTPQSPTN